MYYICEVFEPKHNVNEIKIRAKTRSKVLADTSVKELPLKYLDTRYVVMTEIEIRKYLQNKIKEFMK